MSKRLSLKEALGATIVLLEEYFGVPKQKRRAGDPLDVLVATILSQNTNDVNSGRAYKLMREAFPTWNAVAHAPRHALEEALKTGGMARQKSKVIQDVLQAVKEKFGGYSLENIRSWQTKNIFSWLTSLHGIGMKTASCIALFALGRDICPVDTHVHRTTTRIGLSKGKTPDATFEELLPMIPPGKAFSLHMNLIHLGRTICTAQNPKCPYCPLLSLCAWKHKTHSSEEPKILPGHRYMILDSV